MERQVCELQTVSAKGVTRFHCAQIVPPACRFVAFGRFGLTCFQ